MNGKKKVNEETTVTIYDIAKAAGVSVGTVSRALNRIGYVHPDTRIRIEEAAASLNYIPNRAARTLKTKKTGLILLAIPDMDNPFYFDMIKSVQEVTQANGCSMILYYTGGKASEEIKALKMLRQGYADGMILVNFSYTSRHEAEIKLISAPLVLTCLSKGYLGGHDEDRFDYIGVDAEKGIYLAVRHLAQQGHVRIGYIAGPHHIDLFKERHQGYVNALRDSGLAYDKDLAYWCHYTEPSSYDAINSFFSLKSPPTAVCCANDIMALGAFCALKDKNIRIPEDVSIVGMDNIDTTWKVTPPLSTVAIAQAEIGRKAAELLFKRLDDSGKGPIRSKRVIFEPRLIVRESSIYYRHE
ncbi:MAG: LacI family DNA-binding transcriptional regulator [Clostridia bacterium]|nr:LacI family DNA-binding transcriptional regulator [Clostridia bacterium]